MGWNVLAVGEIGDSRRLDEDVRLSGAGPGVDSEVVVDDEDESASNALILDWRDAEGIADGELELDAPKRSSLGEQSAARASHGQ